MSERRFHSVPFKGGSNLFLCLGSVVFPKDRDHWIKKTFENNILFDEKKIGGLQRQFVSVLISQTTVRIELLVLMSFV